MMLVGFDVSVAAQSAAFFTRKSGGVINILKLVKLMYMAERTSMDRYDEPLFYDQLVSMNYGPVPSTALDLINGRLMNEAWTRFMGGRSGNSVKAVGDEKLDHLSLANTQILEYVWSSFSDVDRFELAEWTHRNCPEWSNPKGSSTPISHENIFEILGKINPAELGENVRHFRASRSALTACD